MVDYEWPNHDGPQWRAIFDTNIAMLSDWAEAMSGGILTVRATDYEHRDRGVSLVRVDGKNLGYHDGFGERSPITGAGTTVYVSTARKLTRRDRKTMVALRDVIRTMFYGTGHWDAETYHDVRADYDRVDVAVAMYNFEHANRLEGVKA